MLCETIQPEDLSVQCTDPFAELDPGGSGSPWFSFSLPEPRIFCSKLFRTLGPTDGEAAALRLGQWLTEGRYAALVMDYRGAVITADPAASEMLADASAAAFPRGPGGLSWRRRERAVHPADDDAAARSRREGREGERIRNAL